MSLKDILGTRELKRTLSAVNGITLKDVLFFYNNTIWTIWPLVHEHVHVIQDRHYCIQTLIVDVISKYTEHFSFSVSGLGFKSYTNITLGIKDKTVFDVPAICTNATEHPTVNLYSFISLFKFKVYLKNWCSFTFANC
jgi:hypothetical protein